jgi:hypothetical protein
LSEKRGVMESVGLQKLATLSGNTIITASRKRKLHVANASVPTASADVESSATSTAESAATTTNAAANSTITNVDASRPSNRLRTTQPEQRQAAVKNKVKVDYSTHLFLLNF